MMMYHPIKFGCKKLGSSADLVETVIFDQMSPNCEPELEDSKPLFLHDKLNLKTANQSSCMPLWPIMLHHHTKFGYRMFSS